MIQILRDNFQIYLIFLGWVIVGNVLPEANFVLIPCLVYLFSRSERFDLVLFGFLFILILSDSLEDSLTWVKSFKPIYALLMGVLYLIHRDRFDFYSNKLFRWFIPYFVVMIICLVFAELTLLTSIQKTVSYILVFWALPPMVAHSWKTRGLTFLQELIAFLAGILAVSILLRYIMPEVAFSHGARMRGVFGNPNGLGIFLIVTFGAVLAVYFSKQGKVQLKRSMLIPIALVLIYISLASGSRTSLLVLGLMIATAIISKWSIWLATIFFLLMVMFYNDLFQLAIELLIQFGMEEQFRLDTLQEGSGRIIAWEFAWTNIQDSFFLGRGLGYDEKLMRDNFEMLSRAGHEGGVHNTYLIIWLNTGLIGLIAFLRGLLTSFIAASKKSKVALPFLFGILVSIMFEPWLAASLNPFTPITIVALTIMLYDNPEQELTVEESVATA